MRWKYNPLILWRISAGQLGLHVTIPLSLFFKNYSKIFIQTDNCVFCSDEKKRKIIEKWRIHIQIASRGKSCHSASTNVREKTPASWVYRWDSIKDTNYELISKKFNTYKKTLWATSTLIKHLLAKSADH